MICNIYFQKTDKGWREILIDIIQETNEEKFRYVLSRTPTAACKVYLSVSIQSCIIMNFILFYK